MDFPTILQHKKLAKLTTFGIDVEARFFCEVNNESEILDLLKSEFFNTHQHIILGGGSNMLFTQNYDGLVILNSLKGLEYTFEDENHVLIKVASGEEWHNFVVYCVDQNLGGVENLSLIPGTVGASPMQNIGAYGVEIKDVFDSLEAIELKTGFKKVFSHTDCQFGYRESIFKQELKNQYMITSVTFKLNKNAKINKSYGAIEQVLEKSGINNPTIKDVSDAVIAIRQTKLPDPKKIGNAGSFFKNPEISNQQFEELKLQFPNIVGYSTANGIKLAAGWLIEHAGWKGFRDGDAGVHKDQALVLVNYNEAEGKQIIELAYKIKNSVFQKFGVEINPEVNIY